MEHSAIGVRVHWALWGGGGVFLPEKKLRNARMPDSWNWDKNALRASCMKKQKRFMQNL